MGLGGTIEADQQVVSARLLRGYTGVTAFTTTGWAQCRLGYWVVDLINQGQQLQRVRKGKASMRLSGVAALYAPGRDFQEYRTEGLSLDESYMVFSARRSTAGLLRKLAGPRGYCLFRDPDRLIGERLVRIGELTFYRRPGFHLAAHGLMVEMLGLLEDSETLAPNLREVRRGVPAGILGAVEQYVRGHIREPLRVEDLARHCGMGLSTFAHAYARQAGESPCRTVRRLKGEAAKRLLLQERLSVKECAARLGFSSEFHFSRLFKRLEGVSPRGYVGGMGKGGGSGELIS